MAELRRRRTGPVVIAAALVLVLAAATAACTPSPPDGRVGDDSATAGDQSGSDLSGGSGVATEPGGGVPSSVAPTTEAPGKQAANAGNICRGRADSFLPDTVAGYSVAASGDVAGSLPAGAAGVQSAGAALVRRDDGVDGLVTAVVFEEQPALSAVVSSTIDLLLQAAGGQVDVTDTTVNGYEARRTTGPKGTTLIAWPECLNVWVVVQAPDAGMANDLAAKVHTP